jgi:putative hydrolase
VAENIAAAAAAGLEAVALTDHGPGHLTYGIRPRDVGRTRAEIAEASPAYPGLTVFLSVEANIRGGERSLDISPQESADYDFLIGGYHLGVAHGHSASNFTLTRGIFATENRIRKAMVRNTDMVLRALYENNLRILTHPGDKAPIDIAAVARACAETDTWMEISNFHSNLTLEEIKIAAGSEAKFVISSDAHSPGRIGSFQKGLDRALSAGLDPERIVNIRRRQEELNA